MRGKPWWLFLLPCIPVLAAWDRFIVPAGTNVSDILISHYPDLLYLQRSLSSGQGIPLWSPSILSGYPFAANPISSMWYPPAWIALLFPLPLGINLMMAVHIFIGVIGFYHVLRGMQMNETSAMLGGLMYGFLPAGFAHIVAGHFTWVCASAWLPWLLASTVNGKKFDRKMILRAGCFLGLISLADLRFAAYSGLFWLGLVVFRVIVTNESKVEKIRNLSLALLSILIAAGLSAAVWIPLFEYSSLSTRSLMTANDSFFLSLPAVQFTGLIVPGLPSSIEWVIYPGAGCLILGLMAASLLSRYRDLFFWLGAGVVCLLWSLGDGFPLNHWLVTLPGVDMLRVPSRGMFFLDVCLIVAAMLSLDYLVKENPQKAAYLRLGTLFLTILVVLIQVFIIASNPEKNSLLVGHALMWLGVACLILGYSYRKLSATVFSRLLPFFILVDLAFFDFNLTGWITATDALAEGKEEAQFILETGENGRVFSPSYSIPQQTGAHYQLEMADGIDPLQLESYSEFILRAASMNSEGYSVTLPPFKTGDPSSDTIGIEPDAAAFGLLNVRYLVSAFPISSDGWELIKQIDHNFIYQNQQARGWAWMEVDSALESHQYQEIASITRQANRISLDASGPGRLVISEVNYPGWQVWVDGQPAVIQTAYTILRAVDLSAGPHTIEFRFIPYTVFAGAGISLMTLVLIIITCRVRKNHA